MHVGTSLTQQFSLRHPIVEGDVVERRVSESSFWEVLWVELPDDSEVGKLFECVKKGRLQRGYLDIHNITKTSRGAAQTNQRVLGHVSGVRHCSQGEQNHSVSAPITDNFLPFRFQCRLLFLSLLFLLEIAQIFDAIGQGPGKVEQLMSVGEETFHFGPQVEQRLWIVLEWRRHPDAVLYSWHASLWRENTDLSIDRLID